MKNAQRAHDFRDLSSGATTTSNMPVTAVYHDAGREKGGPLIALASN